MPIELIYKQALFNTQAFSQQQINYSTSDGRLTVISCQRMQAVVMFIFDIACSTVCDLYCFTRLHPDTYSVGTPLTSHSLKSVEEHSEHSGVYEGNYYLCRSIELSALASGVAAIADIVDACIRDCKCESSKALVGA